MKQPYPVRGACADCGKDTLLIPFHIDGPLVCASCDAARSRQPHECPVCVAQREIDALAHDVLVKGTTPNPVSPYADERSNNATFWQDP